MGFCCSPASALNPLASSVQLHRSSTSQFLINFHSPQFFSITPSSISKNIPRNHKYPFKPKSIYEETEIEFETEAESESEEEEDYSSASEEHESTVSGNGAPPVLRRRRRYRKLYPGEQVGITEEMRFVAMKLRNDGKGKSPTSSEEENDGDNNGETWQPSVKGFLKYLVDSELIFRTVERIVDESTDVSYVYFRKTGLERSDSFSRDLEWFKQHERNYVIPEPSNPGVTYAKYLQEVAERSPPLFLCHFYNIYFSHIAGGQVIAKQVSRNLFKGREMDVYKWEGDAEELLRGVRVNLNALGEHWTRDEKNKCLREATKAFRFLGQIVRLIIL